MDEYWDPVITAKITFTPLEKKILQHGLFTRLKNVKQDGFTYVKFPNAKHSRYEHSLGTLFWANLMFMELFNIDFSSLMSTSPEKSIDKFSDLKEDWQAIRIAALLHDVGHGPFSHVSERLFKRNPEWGNGKLLKKILGQKKGKIHEKFTLHVIKTLEKEGILSKKMSNKVMNILLGKNNKLSKIVSGDLDADRLDYITRDSYYLGLPFGKDVQVIFKSIIQNNLSKKAEHVNDRFLVVEKGSQRALEIFLMSRYLSYVYGFFDDEIMKADLLFISALEKALTSLNKDEIDAFMYHLFISMDDHSLMSFDFPRELVDVLGDKIKVLKDSLQSTFFDLARSNLSNYKFLIVSFLELQKRTIFNLIKINREKPHLVKEVEKYLQERLGTPVKILIVIPNAMAYKVRINDPIVHPDYAPPFIFDYSPVLRGLEQTMFFDSKMCIYFPELETNPDEDKLKIKLINELNALNFKSALPENESKIDIKFFKAFSLADTFQDKFTWALHVYFNRANEYLQMGHDGKFVFAWNKRTGLLKLAKHLMSKKLLDPMKMITVNDGTPIFSKPIYEILQVLEFLDLIKETFNFSTKDGKIIPNYEYEWDATEKQIKDLININKELMEDLLFEVTEYFENQVLK